MKKQPEILAKALAIRAHRNSNIPSEDEMILALAWMRDEISMTQAARALNKPVVAGNILYLFAKCLREAHRQGRLVEAKLNSQEAA